MATIVSGLQKAGAGAAKKVGTASNLDVANGVLGVAGGLAFLGAKKPQINAPEVFHSVAPVQNYEADRNIGTSQIAHNASTAMNNVRAQMGSDWAAYASAALGVNAQSNDAVNQLSQGIGQQKRQDNIATAQQLNSDKEFNYSTQRSFAEAQHNAAQEAYQGQRTQGAGMMQSSLNYMVGKDASDRAFAEKQKLANQQILGTAYENELRHNQDRQGVNDAMRAISPETEKFFSILKPKAKPAPAAAPAAVPALSFSAPELTVGAQRPKVAGFSSLYTQ